MNSFTDFTNDVIKTIILYLEENPVSKLLLDINLYLPQDIKLLILLKYKDNHCIHCGKHHNDMKVKFTESTQINFMYHCDCPNSIPFKGNQKNGFNKVFKQFSELIDPSLISVFSDPNFGITPKIWIDLFSKVYKGFFTTGVNDVYPDHYYAFFKLIKFIFEKNSSKFSIIRKIFAHGNRYYTQFNQGKNIESEFYKISITYI